MPRRRRLAVLPLEDRSVPATHTWDGGGTTGNWSEAANWVGDDAPAVGESDVAIVYNTPAADTTQDIAGLVVETLRFEETAVVSLFLAEDLTLDGAGADTNVLDATGLNSIAGPGALVLTGSAVFFDVSATAGRLLVSAPVAGTEGLFKQGEGTLELAGGVANTFAGQTTVAEGVLRLTTDTADAGLSDTVVVGDGSGAAGSAVLELLTSGELPEAVAVTVRSDGRVDLPAGVTEEVASLTLADGRVSLATGAELTILAGGSVAYTGAGNSGSSIAGPGTLLLADDTTVTVADAGAVADLLISAVVSGADAGLRKDGPGRLRLTAANTFTGPTTVAAGTLEVLGSQPGSDVAVTGGTLGGGGTVGTLAVSGGTLAPGLPQSTAPVTLSAGDTTLSGGTFAPRLFGPPAVADADRLAVTGTLTLSGAALAPGRVGGFPTVGQPFLLVDNDGTDPVVGTFANLPQGATATFFGQSFTVSYTGGDGNDVVLTTAAAPPANTAPTLTNLLDQLLALGGTSGPLPLTIGDPDGNPAGLTVSVTSSNPALLPASGLVVGGSGANRTLTLTPAAGQSGTATVTVTVTDPAGASTSDTFQVTVDPATVGGTPTISVVADRTVPAGGTTGAIPFSVADPDGSPGALTITATSSNATLVPASGLVIGGSGANRTLTVTPAAGQTGTATITLTATDAAGNSASEPFALAVGTGGTAGPFLTGGPAGGLAQPFTPTGGQFVPTTAPLTFPGITGTARVATADITGDGVPDFIAGAGPGGPSRVVVLNGATNATVASFDVFEGSFTGGVFVAAADLNADGRADVIVTPDRGGGPVVAVYSGVGLAGGQNATAQLTRFFGIEDANFRGGARAAAGDVDADGRPDLLVAAGFGGGPRLAIFDGSTLFDPRAQATNVLPPKVVPDFFVFEPTLRNGVFVAAGDLTADGAAEVVVGGGPGGGPRVFALDGRQLANGAQVPVANFFAGDSNLRGGVRVAVRPGTDGQPTVLTGSGDGESARVRVYRAATARTGGGPDQELAPFGGAVLADGVSVG